MERRCQHACVRAKGRENIRLLTLTNGTITHSMLQERYTDIHLSIIEITGMSTILLSAPLVIEVVNITALFPWNDISEDRRAHRLEMAVFIRT